jgi:hypothetical protein
MYWEPLRWVLGHLKQALWKEQGLTVEELTQLSEAIIDYGRMIHAYHPSSRSEVIVEVPELSHRFRETERTIEDALRLLRGIGRAEPTDLDGCWKLEVAGPLPSSREGTPIRRQVNK